jgi:hypothetical protein
MPDSQVTNLHKAFDLVFRSSSTINTTGQLDQHSAISQKLIESTSKLKEINIDLHTSPQMILLYPDLDSESLINSLVKTFSKLVFKLSRFFLCKN